MIFEIFAMFDTVKVEVKQEHQLLMVSEITSFKKGKCKKDTSWNGKSAAALVKKPKVEPKPETKCFCDKGNSH